MGFHSGCDKSPKMFCRCSKARCTRPCIVWKNEGGWSPRGDRLRVGGRRSSTSFLRKDANNWLTRSSRGSASLERSTLFCRQSNRSASNGAEIPKTERSAGTRIRSRTSFPHRRTYRQKHCLRYVSERSPSTGHGRIRRKRTSRRAASRSSPDPGDRKFWKESELCAPADGQISTVLCRNHPHVGFGCRSQ